VLFFRSEIVQDLGGPKLVTPQAVASYLPKTLPEASVQPEQMNLELASGRKNAMQPKRSTPGLSSGRKKAMKLDEFTSLSREQVKRRVLKVLRAAPYNSCRKDRLLAKITQLEGVKTLRGRRRDEVNKRVNRAVGDLKRMNPPKLREYSTLNHKRVALTSRRRRRPRKPTRRRTVRFTCPDCGHRGEVAA
jgi:hypothetical protein